MYGKIKKELGDYQTPMYFAEIITNFVKEHISFSPNKIIEPTCGVGNFLITSIKKFKNTEIIGIDINNNYLNEAKQKLNEIKKTNYKLVNSNIFDYKYNDISNDDNILIIGNPPWAVNSNLTSGELKNLPIKTNFKKYKGLEAITGSSNFDICEYIILDAIKKVNSKNLCLAMLCKTNVAINIIKELKKEKYSIKQGIILKFNAKKIFNVSTDACLLYIEKGKNYDYSTNKFKVYTLKQDVIKYETQMGFNDEDFVTDYDFYIKELDGKSPFEWRQGVKHDSSKVMELILNQNKEYMNGFNQIVDIEDKLVYPLLKSSDIKKYKNGTDTRKHVIITQSKIGEETKYIKNESPKLWDYLNSYEKKLSSRKSSIYKNNPKFSIFGIGEYSFSKYKVAISGFYKEAIFIMIKSDKPIMLDDTCYFLSFNDEKTALITTIILNSDIIKNFLLSITNINSKRPYTKKILSRINLEEATKILDFEYITKMEKKLFQTSNITIEDYENFFTNL
ncbi:class I SAM-dependent methyltransferase [Streptobacillus ratti]|uniref:class I SAM-dependent methyltransferase n=1 Tax=Streptobacillus ratti TaxID=1720557 RepID=UPI000932E512|nr:methyltransferase domain-containing protein [Streptobacillus ratti]